MMRYLVTIIAGTQYDKHASKIKAGERERALEEIRAELAREHGGYTELEQRGGYFVFDQLVHEDGVEFQVLVRDDGAGSSGALLYAQREGERLSKFIAIKLRQQSVLLLVTPVMASFVEV